MIMATAISPETLLLLAHIPAGNSTVAPALTVPLLTTGAVGGDGGDIARFLVEVASWPVKDGDGYINFDWTQVKAQTDTLFWRGKPTTTVAEAVALVERLLLLPHVRDIYFCLSRQRAYKRDHFGNIAAERSKKNAVALKAIWLDIDVKDPPKGYANVGEASAALKAFYHAVGLPPPSAVVFSGGGLHVYWSSNTALTPDEWRPLAERLKSAALKHGLRCDTACTIDRARILRVPDTFNWKGGLKRPVKLLWLGASYDF
jgi:hypothetical protein